MLSALALLFFLSTNNVPFGLSSEDGEGLQRGGVVLRRHCPWSPVDRNRQGGARLASRPQSIKMPGYTGKVDWKLSTGNLNFWRLLAGGQWR